MIMIRFFQRNEVIKSRKVDFRVETETFGPFNFSTPTVHSSKNLRRKQNFEAFVVRIIPKKSVGYKRLSHVKFNRQRIFDNEIWFQN